MSHYKLVIGREAVDTDTRMPVINPATEDVVGLCPVAGLDHLEAAIVAAKRAFPAWSRSSLDMRRSLLKSIADGIEARIQPLAALLTSEQGKPLAQAQLELHRACSILRHFAQADLPIKTFRRSEAEHIYERRVPLGIVAAIVPWNFPIVLLMNKLAPALLAGNCIIAKPAPTTPLTTLEIGHLCASLLPPGVISVLSDSNNLGASLTSHPAIAKVSFTGSTETGRKVFQSGAATLKRLTLELGGNDPALVMDDANLDSVAPQIFRCAMANSGQVCMAIKRVYVPDALYDGLSDRLAKLAAAAVVGNGAEPQTQFGPVQNRVQFERLKGLIDDCKTRGTVQSGKAPVGTRGYFIAPSIVRDIPDDARIVQEEQFGPVLPLLRYTHVDDALTRMNSSIFGLGASVWGSNVARATEVAERVSSGTVWINRHMSVDPSVPFRGARQSGVGVELGDAGLHEFTQAQVVNVSLQS